MPTTVRALAGAALARLGLRVASPPLDPYPAAVPAVAHPFDCAHGVDTSGYLRGDQLHIAPGRREGPLHGSAVWSTAYYAVAPSIFNRALAFAEDAISSREASAHASLRSLDAPSPFARFSFVDLGCGKGRALLLAARHPFREILGVELDPVLARIATTNVHTFAAPWQLCHHLRVVHDDASKADLPLTPTVLFLYHPFLAPVLRRVLRRLERSLRQHPRELWIVYINPEADYVLRAMPCFQEHSRTLLHVTPEDALPDRLGIHTEEVAIFCYTPLSLHS